MYLGLGGGSSGKMLVTKHVTSLWISRTHAKQNIMPFKYENVPTAGVEMETESLGLELVWHTWWQKTRLFPSKMVFDTKQTQLPASHPTPHTL